MKHREIFIDEAEVTEKDTEEKKQRKYFFFNAMSSVGDVIVRVGISLLITLFVSLIIMVILTAINNEISLAEAVNEILLKIKGDS